MVTVSRTHLLFLKHYIFSRKLLKCEGFNWENCCFKHGAQGLWMIGFIFFCKVFSTENFFNGYVNLLFMSWMSVRLPPKLSAPPAWVVPGLDKLDVMLRMEGFLMVSLARRVLVTEQGLAASGTLRPPGPLPPPWAPPWSPICSRFKSEHMEAWGVKWPPIYWQEGGEEKKSAIKTILPKP